MKRKQLLILSIIIILGYTCKDRYDPGIDYPVTGYLVVEGFINSGVGPTSIRLSRTTKLTELGLRYDNTATVTVEGNDNSRFGLTPRGDGLYMHNQLTLDRNKQYRLRIRTLSGEYLSSYATPIATPPIDSISVVVESPGVVMYINTHDPQNKSKYYTWNYEETWEINARYYPSLKYVKAATGQVSGLAPINANGLPDTTRFRCWNYENSSSILVGSSIRLTEDRINLPLYSIRSGSEKFSVLYTVKVNQRALSEQGYDFLQRMKKNTQQVGSIFDAQPSELNSNIKNTTNPLEVVIGFVEVADAQERRIWVDPRQFRYWNFSLNCEEKMVTLVPDSLTAYSYLDPVEYAMQGSDSVLFAVTRRCDDCTVAGVNRKPAYWPR